MPGGWKQPKDVLGVLVGGEFINKKTSIIMMDASTNWWAIYSLARNSSDHFSTSYVTCVTSFEATVFLIRTFMSLFVFENKGNPLPKNTGE